MGVVWRIAAAVLAKKSKQFKTELQRYRFEIEGYKNDVKLMKNSHEKAQREAARIAQVRGQGTHGWISTCIVGAFCERSCNDAGENSCLSSAGAE